MKKAWRKSSVRELPSYTQTHTSLAATRHVNSDWMIDNRRDLFVDQTRPVQMPAENVAGQLNNDQSWNYSSRYGRPWTAKWFSDTKLSCQRLVCVFGRYQKVSCIYRCYRPKNTVLLYKPSVTPWNRYSNELYRQKKMQNMEMQYMVAVRQAEKNFCCKETDTQTMVSV